MKLSFHNMKKILTAGLVAVAATAMLVGCGGGGDNTGGGKKFVNIATGGTAGTYYPIGGAIAEILNGNIEGMNAASVANINMLKDGSVDIAIVQNDITYYAVHGTEMFKDNPVPDLKGIASLYPETCQFVTLDASGIKNIKDLKGKRVAVGAAGSGAEANARQILEAYGITYNDIEVQYLSFAEGASALKDGNVDAAFLTAGYPTSSVQDIASQNSRLVPTRALMRTSRRSPSCPCSSPVRQSMTSLATTSRKRSSRTSTACRPRTPSASTSRLRMHRRACRSTSTLVRRSSSTSRSKRKPEGTTKSLPFARRLF